MQGFGFRSTRLRSADGTLLVVPHKKLIDENLENLTGRDLRKVRVTVPLRYKLSHEELDELTAAVRNTVSAKAEVRGEVQTYIESFGELTMVLVVIYHLPEELPEGAIQAAKNHVNLQIYGAIAPRILPGKEGA